MITVDALDSELTRDTSGVYTLPLADHAAQRGREDIRVLAKRMTQGEQGTTTLVGLNRETRQWIHFRPLARTGWSVAIIVEEADLLTEIQESEFREVVIFSLYVLLMVLVVVVLARRITGPLRQLAGAAREIGHDPLAAKVPAIQTEDEVADLGEALRRMQVDLIQYVEELKSTMDAAPGGRTRRRAADPDGHASEPAHSRSPHRRLRRRRDLDPGQGGRWRPVRSHPTARRTVDVHGR